MGPFEMVVAIILIITIGKIIQKKQLLKFSQKPKHNYCQKSIFEMYPNL